MKLSTQSCYQLAPGHCWMWFFQSTLRRLLRKALGKYLELVNKYGYLSLNLIKYNKQTFNLKSLEIKILSEHNN